MDDPAEGERFFLRLILNHVRSATNFIDLKTFNGVLYNTFREACDALGLLANDNEWDLCLKQATQCK